MYALHRLPRGCTRLAQVRGNATLQAAAATEAAPTPPPPAPAQNPPTPAAKPAPKPASTKAAAAPAKAQEAAASEADAKPNSRRVWPTHRPSISLARPRQYMRPIGVGVLPAYDHALAYIKQDAGDLKKELRAVRAELEKAQADPEDAARVAELQEKVHILEVQSEINLPSVRWKARNGLADLTKPVYRHLIEQRWRQEGALDLVMERVHQMGVVPDLLPEIHPSIDLRVNFPERLPEKLRKANRTKRSLEKVEAGVYLLPEQTRKPPMLYTTVFHPEPRLYTLLMFDLDVPDPENNGFQTYLHWMQPNIELSSSSNNPISLPRAKAHTPYIPPHPQRGTPYHRYALMLVPQQDPTKPIDVVVPTLEQRLGFSYRQLAAEVGLDATKGGGIFMWREIWDETVSKIYAETLKTEEPVYGKPPKSDPYDYFKVTPKYATASA